MNKETIIRQETMEYNRQQAGLLPNAGTRAESFSSMEEIERWFQNKYCDKGGLVCASRELPQQDLNRIANALDPARTRHAGWLREPGNEEWYGPRIAIVFATWSVLKREHEAALEELEQRHQNQVKALEEKLSAAKRELEEQNRKAADARLYLAQLRGVLRELVRQPVTVKALREAARTLKNLLKNEMPI